MTKKSIGYHSMHQQQKKIGLYNEDICLPPSPPRGCPNIYPVREKPNPTDILKVKTFQYTAISDGIKRIYTNQDRVLKYGSSRILDPNSVSYINLFINGILQPNINYTVEQGRLIFSNDLPVSGAPIILQFVIIYG
ncbi:DUF4183 domain-containing protein [Peribacillus frigoritolerans]|uniref:DUF4183 domain-containing protein n=1 Tax=Peribacillus frigoritolerans TaxID=450367 RepID=UPI002079986F|nr:DUF4183 domain-containing protein [Peribacillus frigoritolerans]USK74119.1 DUF4183 domain-containing protein [Peribacillus frigoritolerans]